MTLSESTTDTSVQLTSQTCEQARNIFHSLYYNLPQQTWQNTTFLGYPILKCPLDLWIYQELICTLKPDIIIETGTFYGASAAYLAVMCDLVHHGKVITIDVAEHSPRPQHPRIRYITGSSTAPEIKERVLGYVKGKERVLVILDSDHSKDHVMNELHFYSALVSLDSYVIVEDTNINGHPVRPDWGPGPMEALTEFLESNSNFMIDKTKEKFLLTFNPNGFLKRIK